MQRERVLTGIRSNGIPHIGNYLGAMLPMVEIQRSHGKTHDMFFFVPDLHSFTTPVDHELLYEQTIRNLKYFIAVGMDFWAEGTHLYRQSYVPAHSELTWILDCFAYFGEMRRMTQFKDKSALDMQEGESAQSSETLQNTRSDKVSVGLFNYPVLMAADILLYNAKYVPVGDDQRQHLELTRDLALRINHKFADTFVDGVFETVPVEWEKQLAFAKRDNGVRIRSLRNPEKKMSKSVSDPAGTINLTDDPKAAIKKVLAATTDSLASIHFDWATQPGVTNLLQMLALLSGRPISDVVSEWQGKTRYGELKQAVAQEVEAFLMTFQSKIDSVDETKLRNKLEEDEAKMRLIADKTLLRVQQAVGLRPVVR